MALTFDSKEKEPGQISYRFAGRMVRDAKGAKCKVLDIACARGESTAVLFGVLPEADLLGVDMDPACIAAAEAQRLPGVRFAVGDALATGFDDESFDAIVSGHTIEHLDEPQQKKLLRELKRILKKDGIMIISTPDVSVLRLQGAEGTQPDHVRELEQEELLSLLKDAGWSIKALWGQGVVKPEKSFALRKVLNVLKRLDVFRLRRLFSKKAINALDEMSHPFDIDFAMKQLSPGERAYNMIAVCGQE